MDRDDGHQEEDSSVKSQSEDIPDYSFSNWGGRTSPSWMLNDSFDSYCFGDSSQNTDENSLSYKFGQRRSLSISLTSEEWAEDSIYEQGESSQELRVTRTATPPWTQESDVKKKRKRRRNEPMPEIPLNHDVSTSEDSSVAEEG